MESLLNEIMRRERERFLSLYPTEQANGFYPRSLHLTLGKLELKVPRVRYGKGFRPAILPLPWKRADKDYEVLGAMLAGGYSQAQIERALKALDLPFFQEVLQHALALIDEKLSFYKTQPLNVIGKLFCYADHQLCPLYLRCNLRRELSQEAYKEPTALLYKLRRARGLEEGEELFRALCRVVEQEKSDWAKKLLAKSSKYLVFLQYPEEVRKHIYTTNVVESVNAGIELMRLELGGYFSSERTLEVNLFIQVVYLQDRWWRPPLPTVRSASYRSGSYSP